MLYLLKKKDFLQCDLDCDCYSKYSIMEYRKEIDSIDDLYYFIGTIINNFCTRLTFTYLLYFDFCHYERKDFLKFIYDNFNSSEEHCVLCEFKAIDNNNYVIVYRRGVK